MSGAAEAPAAGREAPAAAPGLATDVQALGVLLAQAMAACTLATEALERVRQAEGEPGPEAGTAMAMAAGCAEAAIMVGVRALHSAAVRAGEARRAAFARVDHGEGEP